MAPPLAHRLLKQLTLPRLQRTFEDRYNILTAMSGASFFEISEIQNDCKTISELLTENNKDVLPDYCALPDSKVWFEMSPYLHEIEKLGVLLTSNESGRSGHVNVALQTSWKHQSALMPFAVGRFNFDCPPSGGGYPTAERMNEAMYSLDGWVGDEKYKESERGEVTDSFFDTLDIVAGACWLINRPKPIGKVHHSAHKGLAKNLQQVGHWPLKGWTEIRLDVFGQQRDRETTITEETGRRALHRCRRYWRRQGEQIVEVRPHWRGDARLGLVRKRYIAEDTRKQA